MYKHFLKRLFDFLISFVAIIVLIPVWIILTTAIFVTDPGTIVFKQNRVGKNKKIFKILKFRTMKMSTPRDVPTHMLENPDQYFTPIGKFLERRASTSCRNFSTFCSDRWRLSDLAPHSGIRTT